VAIHSLGINHSLTNKLRYSNILRCIGQHLQSMDLKAIEIKPHGDVYVVQAWNKGTSSSMDFEKHYTLEDIGKLEIESREKRKQLSEPPNLLSLSQVLRLAGNYVDRTHGRLVRVSWQDQSDKIQSITLQHEPLSTDRKQADSPITTIEELSIHVYKQRKKIAAGPDKPAHRPFVNVGMGNSSHNQA
jgi:hypothetical protein